MLHSKNHRYGFFIIFFLLKFDVPYASLAQLVEQRIRNAWVAGSSPVGGSKRVRQ